MMKIAINIQNRRVNEALAKMPGLIESKVDAVLSRGANDFATEAMAALTASRSVARTKLLQSVLARRIMLMHFEVTAGANYARMVEEGTGPAAGKKSYMPNPVFLRDYVKQRARISFAAKKGTPARRTAMDEVRDRAFALAVHIRKYGTKPHPFMAVSYTHLRAHET
jgi:hypothetical protein